MIALAFAAMGEADQTTPSTQTSAPLAVQEKVAPDTLPTAEDVEIVSTASDDVETQHRFDELRNELRRELLDDRADTINWWLAATAIFFTFFGIVVVLVGYLSFGRFREIEAEARQHAEKARELVEEITKRKKLADEELASLTRMAEQQSHSILLDRDRSEPDTSQEIEEAVQEVQRNPEASLVGRAIADAVSLQRAGRIEEAIERWRSIANVAEGSDNDLAARAWLSVGYLLYERGGEDAGEQ